MRGMVIYQNAQAECWSLLATLVNGQNELWLAILVQVSDKTGER